MVPRLRVGRVSICFKRIMSLCYFQSRVFTPHHARSELNALHNYIALVILVPQHGTVLIILHCPFYHGCFGQLGKVALLVSGI